MLLPLVLLDGGPCLHPHPMAHDRAREALMGPAAAFSMWGESTVAQPEPKLHTWEPSGLDLEPRCRHTWGERLAAFTLQRGPDRP